MPLDFDLRASLFWLMTGQYTIRREGKAKRATAPKIRAGFSPVGLQHAIVGHLPSIMDVVGVGAETG